MAGMLAKMKATLETKIFEYVEEKDNDNPIALLNEYLIEAEKETKRAGKLIERQKLLIGEFKREWEEADKHAEKRRNQTILAEQAGANDLQEFAAREADIYRDRADRLLQSIEVAESQLKLLQQQEEEMNHKLKDMHVRRLQLMGRENVTKAQSYMDKFLNNKDGAGQSTTHFQDMEAYIDGLDKNSSKSCEKSVMDILLEELENNNQQSQNTAQQQ